MSLETAREIRKQLDSSKFKGEVYFAGRGEPTLTKNFDIILDIFIENNPGYKLRITTNGKRIDLLERFFNKEKISFTYDVYSTDIEKYKKIKFKYKKYKNIKVRHRPDTGLLYNEFFVNKKVKFRNSENLDGFTNRGGFLGKKEEDIFLYTDYGCAKLVYNLFINWNGDYNLCCDDWNPIILGNIFDESIEDYTNYNETLNHYRKTHFCENTREGLQACESCSRRAPVQEPDKKDYLNLIKLNEA